VWFVGLVAWIGGFSVWALTCGGIVNFFLNRYAATIPQYTAIYEGGSGDVDTFRFYVYTGLLAIVGFGLACGTALSFWATRRHALRRQH
jgi:hypothetical protein